MKKKDKKKSRNIFLIMCYPIYKEIKNSQQDDCQKKEQKANCFFIKQNKTDSKKEACTNKGKIDKNFDYTAFFTVDYFFYNQK